MLSIIIAYQHSPGRLELCQACLQLLARELKHFRGEIEVCIHETGVRQILGPSSLDGWKYIFTKTVTPFNRAWSLNAGARSMAAGDTFILMDSDLIISRGWLLEALRCKQPSVAWKKLFCLNEVGIKLYLKQRALNTRFTEKVKTPNIKGSAGGAICLPKDVFYEVQGIPEDFGPAWGGEDNAFWSKLVAYGYKFQTFESPLWHLWHVRVACSQNKALARVMLGWTKERWFQHSAEIKDNWGVAVPPKKTEFKAPVTKIKKVPKVPMTVQLLQGQISNVTIILLSWLRVKKLMASLHRLLSQRVPMNICLQVQGSERLTEGTRAMIRAEAKKIGKSFVLFTNGNAGTAGPRRELVEHALSYYDSRYLMTLDDDMILPRDGIRFLLSALEKNAELGAVSLGHTKMRGRVDAVKGKKIQKVKLPVPCDGLHLVDIMGSATMVLRREVFDDCTIDPKYVIGLWDYDLCAQMRKVGWEIGILYDRKFLAVNDSGGPVEYTRERYNKTVIRRSMARLRQKWGWIS